LPQNVKTAPYGGSFLVEAASTTFTPEDFTDEHRAIARATADFFDREVAPNSQAFQLHDFEALKRTLRKSAQAGLVAALVPEKYGGMEMDLVSSLIVTEGMARDASYASCHGAQAGIGVLPVLLFGTEAQKQEYLPRLVSAELLAAYCLTEAQAGSDAMAIRTRADLSSDGSHYILNGQKVWITNGGIADLFTVFAKVGGEHFTAFLAERSWPGVSIGAEEKKMGLKGSSTTAVFFDNVKIPADNVLGEVGRGHVVAFNILNLGRLHLAAFAHGECREALSHSIHYASERKAFGKTIGELGLIQHKLGEMAARMFANESMIYRLAGLCESWETLLRTGEEFAVECSLVKIYGSETLGYVTDEAVQIHGGYGYHQDYPVERAYRDARIYRIFEGTNEINRILATGMLLKRAAKGSIVLTNPLGEHRAAKEIALHLLDRAKEAPEQQEVTAAVTDVMMQTFAMESATLRANKSGSPTAHACAAVVAEEGMRAIESSARTALNGALDPIRHFFKREPVNVIALRRQIAAHLLDRGKYSV
jgi:alkylation response protein AidB-like acyl-CoA dehydrogenase